MLPGARRKPSAASSILYHDDQHDDDQDSFQLNASNKSGRGSLSTARSGDTVGGSGGGGAFHTTRHRSPATAAARGGGRQHSLEDDERQQFLTNSNHKINDGGASKSAAAKRRRLAKLAKEETIEEDDGDDGDVSCAKRMLLNPLRRKRVLVPIIIISCIAAIYCVPFIEIEPRIPEQLPYIPFNFRDGPLRPSSASQFKVEHLFRDQVHGAESVALDSMGNMYMAIEGGFILYAHLNKSSPPKRSYYDSAPPPTRPVADSYSFAPAQPSTTPPTTTTTPDAYTGLVKIAELNGIKHMSHEAHHQQQQRGRRSRGGESSAGDGFWRRECLLDEKVYGSALYTDGSGTPNDPNDAGAPRRFVSHVRVSRCSKPLGLRLSPNENHLYVVDTLSGLYRVDLRVPERPQSTQRLVTKLIDFRVNKSQLLPVTQLDMPAGLQQPAEQQLANGAGGSDGSMVAVTRARRYLNVSMLAVDDLAIDYKAGTNGGDVIYLTVASQNWRATSFFYDLLEGRPSGLVLRFDTGSQQLSVLDPARVAHVRTGAAWLDLAPANSGVASERPLLNNSNALNDDPNEPNRYEPYLGMGAPRLDENDLFDDRPLYFPNGLELTDDRQALLIADTTNKRIIKHFIRGARRGTSDLWAWVPHFPDNIRRGFGNAGANGRQQRQTQMQSQQSQQPQQGEETYWVVGCGHDNTHDKLDFLTLLNSWPRLRKYILKNIYLLGWLIESVGAHVLKSTSVRDYGYSLKVGNSLCQSACSGMMILQLNKFGDVIRSIYSKEFPNDLFYYSQVNEVIDAKNQEHLLYLSSPAYSYITKLTLPTESFDPTSAAGFTGSPTAPHQHHQHHQHTSTASNEVR